jgi:hypothetical protein
MKIITNNQPRELVCFADLPAKAQSDFDYVKEDEKFSDRFVQYKGAWYDVNEYQRVTKEMRSEYQKWDGYQNDSYFSGTLIKFVDDNERVIVGRWYC